MIMNTTFQAVLDRIKRKIDEDRLDDNIGLSERVLSVFSGSLVLGMSIKTLWKRPITGCAGIAVGGAMLYRGITGHSSMKKVMDKITDEENVTVVEHRYFVK